MFRKFVRVGLFVGLFAGFLGAVFAFGEKCAQAEELCPEPVAAVAGPAFERFLDERGDALKLQIKTGVCTGADKPVALPNEADILNWLNSSNNPAGGGESDRASGDRSEFYSCFGRMFIAKIIEIRTEMETCLADSDCAGKLCSEQQPAGPGSEKGSGSGQKGLGGNMADIYDQNARDLMAIP